MAGPNPNFPITSEDTEQAIISYASKAHTLLINQFSLRSHLEQIDRNYMRENDYTKEQVRSRQANYAGDSSKFQNVTVPIVMPQVEAALGYMANVFCTGYPMFGVASDPTNEDASMQMETIIAENAVTAKWTRELIMFFRDGLKYNLHGIECDWQQRTTYTLETDLAAPNGAKPKTQLWQGNVLRRMDLYNTFFDPRVHPSKIHEDGEFAGYIEMMGRVRMKKMMNDLFGKVPVKIVERALESAPAGASSGTSGSTAPFIYYVPIINPYPILDRGNLQTFDWMAWATNFNTNRPNLRYTNVYEVMKIYGRIIPRDFGMRVPEENTPQVWKFIIVNGQVVVWAERMPNAHNYIPIFFGQPLEDGLDFQTKSFAQNVTDLQSIASAMWNGFIASKRRLVGDRVLYDPSKIREKDINSTNPAAKIPVRPAAYGKPLGEAVFQFPYRDEQAATFVQAAEAINSFANTVNGQNPAQQGQFVKGNKTKFEYDDIMGRGNTHNQVMAIMSEAQVFTPLKEVIKLNILQFQQETTLFNRDSRQQVKVDPVALRKAAVHFKVSDGLLPTEKELSSDEFMTALQVIGSSPQIASGYNLAPMVSYMFKLRGADLRPFEKPQLQVAYEQQVAAWQQAAAQAAKTGAAFNSPMPQMPPQLQQLLQSQNGVVNPSQTSEAEEATQGS